MPEDERADTFDFGSFTENVALAAIQGIDRNGVILHWNAGSEKLYGFPAAEAVGQRLSELIMSGTASAQLDRALGEAWESGQAVPPSAWPVTNKKGEGLWVYTTLLPESREGSVTEVFCMGVDMTGRKRAEEKLARINRLYSMFRKVGKATVRCREPEELYEQVCRIAVENGSFLMAWVGLVDPTNQLVVPVARWGNEKGYLEKTRTSILEIPDGLGPTGTSVREDRYDICQDIENDPRFSLWRDEALKRRYRSNAAFPLRIGSQAIGALTLYADRPRFFDSEEVDLLESLAEDISFAIEGMNREERRKGAQEALRRSEEYFRSLIENALDIICILDSKGDISYTSPSVERLLGYKRSELREKRIVDFLPKDVAPVMTGVLSRIVEDPGSIDNVEILFRHKDGSWRALEVVGKSYIDELGNVEVILNARDVTERRKAEEALKESEEQYRTIFESTGTAMCIIDENATVTFLNQEFERMTGYSAGEVEGKMDFAGFLAPDDREEFLKHHRDAREAQRNVPVHFECELMDNRGNALSMFASMGFMSGRNSSVLSLVDLSKEKGYERDLQETAERLRHFLTVASHELRHPVTVVKGYATTLTKFMEEMPREQVLELLGDINNAADRLTRYVSELMDVSRVEEGRFPIERKEVDPAQLMRTSIEDMRMMGIQNEFAVKVDPGCGLVNVDPGKFVQLVVILLENAVQFSPQGSGVDIEVVKRNRGFVVDVKDQGVGITEEDQDSVFDRFFQVEETIHHSTPGIGLGLYIAREIVRGHGGEIHCRPREGGGTVFRFSIP